MRVYQLTPEGKKIARSVNDTGSGAWKVLRYLDRVGSATTDQIAQYTGLQGQELASAIGQLKRGRAIAEVGG